LCAAALLVMTAPATAPADSGYSVPRAKAYARAGDWNGLLAYAKAWTQAAPNDPDGWSSMALAYGSRVYGLGLQRSADAIPAYQRAVALRPTWPEAWYALGMTQQELGQYDESIVAFNHAAEQAPNRPNYWNSLAASCASSRRRSSREPTTSRTRSTAASSAADPMGKNPNWVEIIDRP
jgi:tetratricopeptide (TPR) repeat protein